MSTSARSIIEAGWRRSTSFDVGVLAQDPEVLAHLNRVFQHRFARWAARAGDRALASSSVLWVNAPAIAVLPSDQIDIVRLETADGLPISIVPAREANRSWHLAPVCYQVGSTLRSRGAIAHRYGYERDPANGDTSSMLHKAAPATIALYGDSLDARFPVRHEMGLVLEIALMLSIKDEGGNLATMQALREEIARDEAAFAADVGETTTARQAAHTGLVPAAEKGG